MGAENVFYTNFTIDWIGVTFDEYNGLRFSKQLGYKGWASDVEGVPSRGYNKCRELETGALISWHTDRKEMGVHVTLSGSTLRYYSTLSVDWHTILKWVKKYNGRTSRVDLAIDMHNGELKMADFCEENIRAYKGKGRTPKYLPVGTEKAGWTIYVGSRSSDKYLRVYHKGMEQKTYEDYIRIELECKGEIAHAVGWEFPEKSKNECVDMARTLIRSVADFDLSAWDMAMSGNSVGFSTPQGKQRDTLGWLIKICAPALAKTIAKFPNEDILGEFDNALRAELQSRGLDIR